MPKYHTILLSLFFAALQLWQSHAFACSTITLVSSNSHFGMVHRIEASLYSQPERQPKLVHIIAENIQNPQIFGQSKDSCLIVTIGSEALNKVLKSQTKAPILSVLTRKNTFHYLLKEHHRHLDDPQAPISVIYLDQPLERQLNLLQSLLPKEGKQNIGILLGPSSLAERSILQKLSSQKNLILTTVYVNKFENPVGVLDALLNDAEIVLAIPDNRIYNPKTTRGMLLTAFHKRVPLVGYSRTYVNNGALAAIYSTTKQLADQTAKQILAIIQNPNKKPSFAHYPEEFSVAVNYQVARSLGLTIESESQLKSTIEKLEK